MPSASLPAVASRLQRNFDSKILKVDYAAATTRESASARRLAERQRTAPQAKPPKQQRDAAGPVKSQKNNMRLRIILPYSQIHRRATLRACGA
jgi:hypothetical protein